MKIHSNYTLSSILWISHFLTDALAAFVLTNIAVGNTESVHYFSWYFALSLAWYFIIYNFLAFFLQIFFWYFFDTIRDTENFFKVSKCAVVGSFWLYIVGTLVFHLDSFISITLVWLGSCFFHLWSWNIALISEKNKASHLGIFWSWWVIWLSFWTFMALYFQNIVFIFLLFLLSIWAYIWREKNYTIEKKVTEKKQISKIAKFLPFIVLWLWTILVIRSAIWTHFQWVFSWDIYVLLFLAIAAFFWKITWWFVEDARFFREKYLFIIWLFAILSIYLYSFEFKFFPLLLLWTFLVQFFLSPITYILSRYLPENKSEVIGFSFWCSLVLGYLVLNL